jgi:putative transposase
MDTQTARKPYPSDLTDAQWAQLGPPAALGPGGGRPRLIDLREVANAILSIDKSGCAWHALPHDFPPEGTVRGYFHAWRRSGVWERILDALRLGVRRRDSKEGEPTAAMIDSQSIKGNRTSGLRGYDAGKRVKGTKRHLLVDTMGLLLCVVVHAANLQDRNGAKLVSGRAKAKCASIRLTASYEL